jgi:multicomponent Na+:H+ antiporter subunit G
MLLAGIGLIVIGLFFLLVAAIGVVRFPDVFTRSHAVGLTDSLGAFFLLLGLAMYQGLSANLVRIVVVLVLLYLLNPVITHATVRAALRSGLKPWSKEQELSANSVDVNHQHSGRT